MAFDGNVWQYFSGVKIRAIIKISGLLPLFLCIRRSIGAKILSLSVHLFALMSTFMRKNISFFRLL